VEAAERAELQHLMARLASGDRSAFRPVFDRVYPLVRHFTSRALGDSADAEDAAQTSVTRIFFRAAEFDPRRDPIPWIASIAANECRTLRRKIGRRREALGRDPAVLMLPDGGTSPEEASINRDLAAALAEILGSMRPCDVEAILATARGDRVASLSAPTFRKRVQRGLDRLRTAWRAKHDAE
jgi:RNA polymerase sigma factor (sigma-70 family)